MFVYKETTVIKTYKKQIKFDFYLYIKNVF